MIEIGIDPTIARLGPLQLSWHGLFTFLAVAAAVFLVARWARRDGLSADIVYNTAVFAIIGGIVGARLVHVVDEWEYYGQNPAQILALTSGGVGLWGGLLGGLAGGLIAAWRARYPIRHLMDLTAPALLVAQAIGRVGDVINGEHCARETGLPWGVAYTHPESPAFSVCYGPPAAVGAATPATHPAVGYELLFDVAVFAAVFLLVRGRIRPRGMLFALYLALYAAGRLIIQTFFRLDPPFLLGLQEAQVIAVLVLLATVPLLLWKARPGDPAAETPYRPPGTRAERRRRQRSR